MGNLICILFMFGNRREWVYNSRKQRKSSVSTFYNWEGGRTFALFLKWEMNTLHLLCVGVWSLNCIWQLQDAAKITVLLLLHTEYFSHLGSDEIHPCWETNRIWLLGHLSLSLFVEEHISTIIWARTMSCRLRLQRAGSMGWLLSLSCCTYSSPPKSASKVGGSSSSGGCDNSPCGIETRE